MPVHDWTRVDAGIFHHFHHSWIEEIQRALNAGLLPDDFYAMAEQHAAGFGPDVLTLQAADDGDAGARARAAPWGGGVALLLTPPAVHLAGQADLEFYRRKQSLVAVRHVSGDRIVAVLEIVSAANKAGRKAFRDFVAKAAEFLSQGVHLVIIDLQPRTRRDPQGIHAAIWEEMTGQEYTAPSDKPFTLASYEAEIALRAFVEHVAVGDVLPDMPLFLQPGGHVPVPLEATYRAAYAAVPRRWRNVLGV